MADVCFAVGYTVKMIYTKKAINMNESVGIIIPIDLARYLQIEAEDEVCIEDEKGKHGPYISIWKKTK